MLAIILAAGTGERLQSITDKPKCLLPVGGETFLSRQLRILKECRIDKIAVVIGYQAEEIASQCDGHNMVYNFDYKKGSIVSLGTAQHLMRGDTLVVNSDVVFSEDQLNCLLSTTEKYCLLVDNRPCDWEATKVTVNNGTVVGIGKTLPLAFGEYTGLALIRESGIADFRRFIAWSVMDEPQGLTPIVFQKLIENGYRVGYELIEGPWVEVDTPEDYEEARRLFLHE